MSVVAPTTAVPMSTGLAVALNVLPAPSFSSRKCLAFSKLGLKPKSRSISVRDVRHPLDRGELEHGLSVVGDRAVGVDGDCHRPHAEEAERHESEGEDRRGEHQLAEAVEADPVADGHQADDRRGPSNRR